MLMVSTLRPFVVTTAKCGTCGQILGGVNEKGEAFINDESTCRHYSVFSWPVETASIVRREALKADFVWRDEARVVIAKKVG